MEEMNLLTLIVENVIGFVIGTLLLGFMLEFARAQLDKVRTARFRGWKLVVIPDSPSREPYEHELLWDEVRKFEQSPFENRKFIQSVCTSEGIRLDAGQISVNDKTSWVFKDNDKKEYRFDFGKFLKLKE